MHATNLAVIQYTRCVTIIKILLNLGNILATISVDLQFDLAEAFNFPHAHKDLILTPLNTHFLLYQS